MKMILITGLFFSIFTNAATLSPSYIMSRMVDDRNPPSKPIKKIELNGEVSDLKTNQKYKETIQFDLVSEKIKVYLLNSSSTGSVNVKETKLMQLAPLGLAWFGLAVTPQVQQVKATIDKLEIVAKEADLAALKRIGTRPVWEWGEQALVQIEKDEFLLAGFKLIERGVEGDSFVVEGYNAGSGKVKYPSRIRFRKAKEDLFLYELKNIKLNSFSEMTETEKSEDGKAWFDLVR